MLSYWHYELLREECCAWHTSWTLVLEILLHHIRLVPQPTTTSVGIKIALLDSLVTCWVCGQPSITIPYGLLSESSSPQRERSHERLFNHMNATFLTLLTEHIAEFLILMFPLDHLYNCNCTTLCPV